jgi:hypothetical protein
MTIPTLDTKKSATCFLDQALGEFDVESKISYLRFFSKDDPLKLNREHFSELPEHFDELYTRLSGLSGKPS